MKRKTVMKPLVPAPFVPWNTGPDTSNGKKSNPYTMSLRADKLAKKKELYLASRAG